MDERELDGRWEFQRERDKVGWGMTLLSKGVGGISTRLEDMYLYQTKTTKAKIF